MQRQDEGDASTFLGRLLTPNISGADAFSAFQKAVRRSDWTLARQVVAVFHSSGYANALWNRIFLICSEDIGVADAWLVSRVFQQHDAWQQSLKRISKRAKLSDSKRSPDCALHQLCAARLLVEAPKCRLNDNVIAHPDVYLAVDQQLMPNLSEANYPVPKKFARMALSTEFECGGDNYYHLAAIRCTASTLVTEERRMLDNVVFFYALRDQHRRNGCVLDKCNSSLGQLFRRHIVKPIVEGLVERCGKRMRTIANHMAAFCGRVLDKHLPQQLLWVVHFLTWASMDAPAEQQSIPFTPFTLASGADKIDDALCKRSELSEVFTDAECTQLTQLKHYEESVSPFPDYVYDKHTARGARLGRGMAHFYEHGAALVQPPNYTGRVPVDYFLAAARVERERREQPDDDGTRKRLASQQTETAERSAGPVAKAARTTK